jgi:hypothetical protein
LIKALSGEISAKKTFFHIVELVNESVFEEEEKSLGH